MYHTVIKKIVTTNKFNMTYSKQSIVSRGLKAFKPIIWLLLIVLMFAVVSDAFRAGIGGRIAIYPRSSSKGSKMMTLIKNDWNCNPFYKCNSNDFACMLNACPYNKTSATDCPNQIVGQYSSMCLELGNNDLKQKIFLGSSFSLVLEPDVVVRCIKYDIYSHFVSECELFRVNQVNEKLTELVNTKVYPNHHLVYYRTTRSLLEQEKKQFELMQKQIKFNNVNIEFDLNDYRKVDFEIQKSDDAHQFKVSSKSGFSFTLPEGVTEKYKLPIFAELSMDIKVHNECYWAYQSETIINIKKTWSCYFNELLTF
jgi:hypothetical protein